MAESWEDVYRNNSNVWKPHPTGVVRDYTRMFKPGPVLDLGCGDGRNGLFLAEQGFEVRMVDFAPTAIERVKERAGDLDVTTEVADLRECEIPEGAYSIILACNVLQLLPDDEARTLITRMYRGISAIGCVIVTYLDRDGAFIEEAFEKMGSRVLYTANGRLFDAGHPGRPEPHVHSFFDLVVDKGPA